MQLFKAMHADKGSACPEILSGGRNWLKQRYIDVSIGFFMATLATADQCKQNPGSIKAVRIHSRL